MAEEKDYLQVLNRARRKRRRSSYRQYGLIGLGLVILAVALVLAGWKLLSRPASGEGRERAMHVATPSDAEKMEAAFSPEEEAARLEAAEKQKVVDSYENLGLVIATGYIHLRETPGGTIIGKLPENSACEILESEGDWIHVTSGGLEGYVASRYVASGEAARQQALEYVRKYAVVRSDIDRLRIRSGPDDSVNNVIGAALPGESYAVEEELGGWIKIPGGYVSADYVEVRYGLREAQPLSRKEMALNQYDNLLVSKVENYLNIRSDPSKENDSNIIGKLPGKAAGEILESLDGWYKIRSGSITGYVSADSKHVAVGQEARDIGMKAAELTAIVNTDRLNVRLEPNTNSKIWTQISKEERYHVTEELDEWVRIELDAGDSEESPDKAYISTRDNNVEVRYALDEAIKFSPLEERANQQASLRNKVVNYALQFVGGRYVWGGNDPHTGADCSGFVRYVLRNVAGVDLPRTSREQAKTGRAIKSSEMRPGDLIFYANSSGTVNHVAMYIGNGQIVHAASRRSGIRISTWNYRSPKTIRSFLD